MKKNIELKYLQQVLMLIPGNVYWKDTGGHYLGCNAQQLHVARKKSLDEILGKTDKDLYPKEIAGCIMQTDKEIIEKRQEKTLEEIGVDNLGAETVYLTKKSPLYDEFGQVVGLIGIGVDISEKKKAEQSIISAKEAAEAASQAKTEFLENMRHDIRTPLSGMVGCARIIKSEADDPEKVSEYAEDLIQSSEALLNFLNKVLEGIKVANGEMPLIKKKFDFKKTVQAIINLNKSLATKKNLDLTLEIDEKIPPYLVGDPIRLQRIVLELVANALRFTQQGSVDIKIKKLKKNTNQQTIIEITVKDTGIGIPANKQDEIFTPFTRLTPSYQGIYKGLGLGLSIVKQFINDLDGEIYVESKVKKGTIFTCRIPLQVPLIMDNVGVEDISLATENEIYINKNNSKINAAQSSYDSASNQKRLLLVEDDKLAAKIAQSILAELDCSIDVAPDAKTALENIQNKDYQLILMDIGLPDMDGIALTHRIRLQQWQRTDTTPIIGLTAHIDVENRQRCLDAGMNTVILKPLNKDTAKELLKTFVPDTSTNGIASSTGIRPVTGAVLDVDALKAILKDEELIKDCLHLMVLGLKKDLVELPRLHQSANWQAIREIAHKRQGGASYCEVKRLEQACKQIDDYIREKGPNDQANTLYRQLIQEMESAQTVCEEYLK